MSENEETYIAIPDVEMTVEEISTSYTPVHSKFGGFPTLFTYNMQHASDGKTTVNTTVNSNKNIFKDVACESCKEKMRFVMQVYAPLNGKYHRVLYLFVCMRNEKCRKNGKGNWRLFRTERLIDDIVDDGGNKSLLVNHDTEGNNNNNNNKNNNNNNNNKNDTIEIDWTVTNDDSSSSNNNDNDNGNQHDGNATDVNSDSCNKGSKNKKKSKSKKNNSSNITSTAGNTSSNNIVNNDALASDVEFHEEVELLKPYWMDIFPEPSKKEVPDQHILQLLKNYEESLKLSSSSSQTKQQQLLQQQQQVQQQQEEEEEEEISEQELEEKIHRKFLKRIARCPDQCFRYGTTPIFATSSSLKMLSSNSTESPMLGRCLNCNAPRMFEGQLMPPFIYFVESNMIISHSNHNNNHDNINNNNNNSNKKDSKEGEREATKEMMADMMKMFNEGMSWSTVALFSCSADCRIPSSIPFVEEFVFVEEERY